jgi:prepilin-type N-terminal cleavage/methylation domain-containing protein
MEREIADIQGCEDRKGLRPGRKLLGITVTDDMKQKDTDLRDDIHRTRLQGKGFSLIELLVALAISGFLSIGLWALMQSQHNTYRLQDTSAEMQQNLRAAVDRISRDLMAAGQGPQWQMTTADGNTTTWYTGANWLPYAYTAATKKIDLIGNTSGVVASLKNPGASSGATTITLATGGGANFSAGAFISIGGAECARVTNVAGDVLTIDTNPAGTTHALQSSYPTGTYVFPLRWVTYAVGAGNVLTMDVHDGNDATTVANGISALNLTTPEGDNTLLTLTITGSASNGIASTVINKIRMRNSPFV